MKVRGGDWTHGCCSGCDVITIRAHGENAARSLAFICNKKEQELLISGSSFG
jgi:hypothetical protein